MPETACLFFMSCFFALLAFFARSLALFSSGQIFFQLYKEGRQYYTLQRNGFVIWCDFSWDLTDSPGYCLMGLLVDYFYRSTSRPAVTAVLVINCPFSRCKAASREFSFHRKGERWRFDCVILSLRAWSDACGMEFMASWGVVFYDTAVYPWRRCCHIGRSYVWYSPWWMDWMRRRSRWMWKRAWKSRRQLWCRPRGMPWNRVRSPCSMISSSISWPTRRFLLWVMRFDEFISRAVDLCTMARVSKVFVIDSCVLQLIDWLIDLACFFLLCNQSINQPTNLETQMQL